MAFEMLKTDYQDDVLNTSVNQVRKYMIVNNADGSISLVDVTVYTKTGTFIGAKDINTICRNMNTIMGFIETSSGDLAAEFQTYFNEQKTLFETGMNNENISFVSQFDAYLVNFKASCSSQFTAWYDSNTVDWSQDVTDRINAIIQSLTVFLADNGQFVLNKAYSVGNIVSYNLGDGITRGYIAVNPVPANSYIYPTNEDYFANITREGIAGIGLGLTPRRNWSDQITYVLNDLVIHDYVYWRCLNQNTNSEPSESNAKWEKQWDITSEMPIAFDEPEENSFSFMEILSNIVSGTTLENLFTYVKSAFKKFLNKFKDTEYTATGASITYDTSNDSSVIISDIDTSISDFNVISENNAQYNVAGLDDYAITGAASISVSAEHQIVVINGNYDNASRQFPTSATLNSGDYIFKIIQLSGSISGSITFQYWVRNPSSSLFVNVAETNSETLKEVEFSLNYNTDLCMMHIVGATGTTTDNYKFMVVVCNKNKEYKADSALVISNNTSSYIMNSYEGTTNIFTTSEEPINFTAEFKSKFWYLKNNKLDKTSVVANLSTTVAGNALDATQGKILDDKITTITDNLDNNTVIIPTVGANVTRLSGGYVKQGKRVSVSISVKFTTASTNYSVASSLPTPISGTTTGIATNSSLGGVYLCEVTAGGGLTLFGSFAVNETYILSVNYVSN